MNTFSCSYTVPVELLVHISCWLVYSDNVLFSLPSVASSLVWQMRCYGMYVYPCHQLIYCHKPDHHQDYHHLLLLNNKSNLMQ